MYFQSACDGFSSFLFASDVYLIFRRASGKSLIYVEWHFQLGLLKWWMHPKRMLNCSAAKVHVTKMARKCPNLYNLHRFLDFTCFYPSFLFAIFYSSLNLCWCRISILLNCIFRRKQDEVNTLEDTIRQRSEQQRKAGIELEATCHICLKTKFADGVGHMCHYCNIRCCARCGGKTTIRGKVNAYTINSSNLTQTTSETHLYFDIIDEHAL